LLREFAGAQGLASKYGGNPLAWADVSYWLLQKSTQQYSSDDAVKFGFCRGVEPVNYVEQILRRYGHYKDFVVASRRAPRPFGAGLNSIAPSSTRP
jgi:membrane-bound lytic murein transglycosylase F